MPINSPYNFVPMAEKVHFPQWQSISQDLPEQDALSGVIEYSLNNASPLLVGDERVKDERGDFVNFFKTPDNEYAIPGTSIKGMLRNWLEIVTHSRLSIINDTWLSFRDLTNKEEYCDLLTDEINQGYKARSQAGWLKFQQGEWKLYPAELWRIENAEIERVFNIRICEKESEKIYKNLRGIQEVSFNPEAEKVHNNHSVPLIYAAANGLSRNLDQPKKGHLIVTGQMPGPKKPQPGKSKGKHMNFLFSSPQDEPLCFESDDVLRGFLDINHEKGDFKYLKKLNYKHGIPVFYLPTNGKVSQMGMAQMFRFPYKHSVAELRYDDHVNRRETRLDFSQILFGSVEDQENDQVVRKGRVSFSLAKCQNSSVDIMSLPPTVLGAPRNSFYPAYIDQSTAKAKYKTYNQKEAKLAGFKRYGVHKQIKSTFPPVPNNNYKVAVQMRPLPAGQQFKGKVRFHNLKPEELGALIFAMQITNEQPIFHQLGMAKPYGLGKVKFDSVKLNLVNNQSEEIDTLVEKFKNYLTNRIGGLKTLNQLLILQNETTFSATELQYLDFPKGFVTTKKSSGKEKLVSINEKADTMAKQQELQQKEAYRKEKIAEAQARQEAERNKESTVDLLVKNELNGEINKSALEILEKSPELYRQLSNEDRLALKNKITGPSSPWYSGLNKRAKKKWRDALPDLLRE